LNNKIYLIPLLMLVLTISSFAVPTITPYVNDFANLLTSEQISSLNLYAQQIEKETTVEIAIITTQNTEGQDRTLYATEIGNTNGVGQKVNTEGTGDNGVVILWSLDNEKGGAIATGRGIESILNDAKVTRIGRAARPLFDEGKTYDAFKQIMDGIYNEVNIQPTTIVTDGLKSIPYTLNQLFFICFIILFVFFVILIMSLLRKSTEYEESKSPQTAPKYLPKGFKKKYHIIQKGEKYYKRKSDGSYDLITLAMLLYLLNNWDNRDISSSNNSSTSYHHDDDSYSSSSGGFGGGSFGGGSFGGGGGKF